MDHLLDLILTAAIVEHPCLPECVFNPLKFLDAHDHVFFCSGFSHHATFIHYLWTQSMIIFIVILFLDQLLLNLFKPAHHFRVLGLHDLQLRS